MSTSTRALAAWAAFVAAVAVPGAAAAQVSSWQIVETTPGEPTEKQKNPPPNIKVRVIGEPAPKDEDKSKWKLEDVDQKKKMKGVTPTTVIPFHKSSDSLAIVVLVEGHQYYFGNDKYVQAPPPPDPSAPSEGIKIITKVSKGVYDVICTALDAPAGKEGEIPTTISTAGNASSSKGALIVYSVGADVRYPMGPLKDVTCDKLGAQELQKGKTSRELGEGLRESLAQLKKASATRRVLFVISDGFSAGGVDDVKALQKQYETEKIDIFAFHLEAGSEFIAGDDPQKNTQIMKALGAGENSAYYKIKDAKDLGDKIANAVTAINSRFYLIFPGQVLDAKTKLKSGFDWDGQEHELVLMREDEAVTEKNQTTVLVPVWGQSKGGSLWWLWIAIPGGLILLVGLVALLTRKKPQPQPQMPMPVMAPPPVAAPPPQIQAAPAQANKTMAINISSGDGVPVVGWLVPINGPQQYQTFKLFAGVTKVGNAHGAHIIINDGFMSSEHAHIAMSPNGFTVIDNNSTNGTFVNERRVQRHELIDNDVIKFGKTDCKFKTINT
ncbi:MAG: FHA domain-containing protein [Deltaproteobacteria bacterium]|nr:FHA domain-containing protein [Kofleriaceae bacterium]